MVFLKETLQCTVNCTKGNRHSEKRHSGFVWGGAHNPLSQRITAYFFLLGRWVKAEAAAVLAALLDFGLRSTLEAAEAAFLLVTSLLPLLAMKNHLLSTFLV